MKPIACHPLIRVRRVLGIALLAWISLVPSRVNSQQLKVPEKNGTEILRRILHERGCRPLSAAKDLFANSGNEAGAKGPEGRLLIILGSPSAPDGSSPLAVRPGNFSTVRTFGENGGAILLASDMAWSERGMLVFGSSVVPGPVVVPDGSEAAYGNNGQVLGLLVEPTSTASPFVGLKRIAAIRPGYITSLGERFDVVARLPKGSGTADNAHFERQRAFAVASERDMDGRGPILVMADQSVFSNALLWQVNGTMANDNFQFAQRCVDWLTESGKRSEVLFIQDGEIIDNFNIDFMELPPPPLPPLEDVVHAVNQGIYGIESENHFNEWIAELGNRIPMHIVLVLVTIGLAAVALIRLGQAKYYAEPGVPTLSAGVTQLVPSVSLVTQRKRWALREGTFTEIGQALARELFEPLGLSSAAPPLVRAQGNWWKAWRIRNSIRKLWHLAYATPAGRISGHRLATIRSRIAALRSGLADGTIQIGDSANSPVNR
jgi:hypothetical protein